MRVEIVVAHPNAMRSETPANRQNRRCSPKAANAPVRITIKMGNDQAKALR
jgi:hypothetical protein